MILDSKQIAFMLNIPERQVFAQICQINKETPSVVYEKYGHKIGIDKPPIINVDTARYSQVVGVDIERYVHDMDKNFIHSKECMDRIFKICEDKLEPDPRTRAYPKYISLPRAFKTLVSEDTYDKVKQAVRERFPVIDDKQIGLR